MQSARQWVGACDQPAEAARQRQAGRGREAAAGRPMPRGRGRQAEAARQRPTGQDRQAEADRPRPTGPGREARGRQTRADGLGVCDYFPRASVSPMWTPWYKRSSGAHRPAPPDQGPLAPVPDVPNPVALSAGARGTAAMHNSGWRGEAKGEVRRELSAGRKMVPELSVTGGEIAREPSAPRPLATLPDDLVEQVAQLVGARGVGKLAMAGLRSKATRQMVRELSITSGNIDVAMDGRHFYAMAALDVDGQGAPAGAPASRSEGDSLRSPRVVVRAAAHGDLDLLKLLRARGAPFLWDARVCEAAVEHGHGAVVEWLGGLDPPCPWDEDVCAATAWRNNLPLLQWLRAQTPPCPWDETLCRRAAGGDDGLPFLQWAHAQNPPCPWDAGAFQAAIRGLNLPMCDWMLHQMPPCPIDAAGLRGLVQLGFVADPDLLSDAFATAEAAEAAEAASEAAHAAEAAAAAHAAEAVAAAHAAHAAAAAAHATYEAAQAAAAAANAASEAAQATADAANAALEARHTA